MRGLPVRPQIAEKLPNVPDQPGAYLIKDAAGEVIYVGKARSLRKRLRAHFRDSAPRYGWTNQLYANAEDLDYVITRTELEALLLEASLIKEHKPRYNIRLSDDKSYPYLRLTEELYPRLMVLRDLPREARVAMPGPVGKRRFHDPKRHQVHGLGTGKLFGPYPDSRAMWRTMRLVSQLFGLRSCARKLDGTSNARPCLNFHIGRCAGPCRGLGFVSEPDYGEVVRQAASFLEGKSGQVARHLEAEMRLAAAALSFERAAKLRDKLKAVNRATEGQVMVANENRDQDVIAVAQGPETALVALFMVRAGRLVNQQQFELANVEGRKAPEVVDAFLIGHYSRSTHIPAEVLVPEEIEDQEAWGELLAEARGGPVRVYRPQRGQKRRLLELAAKNAASALASLTQRRAQERMSARATLQDLAEALGLTASPQRIECFDISTTQGRDSTGSQVVFTAGAPDKRNYRRYRMRATEGKPDDYAMMAEMVQRRVQRAAAGEEKFLPLPDLVLVDGGKGQLSTVLQTLRAEGNGDLAVAALAKQEEQVFVPGRAEPVDMTGHRAAQLLLQRIRDEAHRFAISHHRGLRDSQITKSALDEVPGIGPARRRALLSAFPSVQAMLRASVDELAAVPGMNRKVAEAMVRHFSTEQREEEPR